MPNYEFVLFWFFVSIIGMMIPFIFTVHKMYWRRYLVPAAVNIIGVLLLVTAQEYSKYSGESDWGYVLPLGSYFFLAPISILSYIIVISFIKIDLTNSKNT